MLGVIGLLLLSRAYGSYSYSSKQRQTRLKGQLARAKRDAKVTNFCTKNIDVDFILSLDCTQMREELIKGSFTSVDLIHVFGDRCQRIARALNLSTEELFSEAMEMARLRDKERAEAIKKGEVDSLPPLHGIPMSFKDQFDQVGHLSTCGTAYLCDRVKTEDAVFVKLFVKAGAIPMIRGNVP